MVILSLADFHSKTDNEQLRNRVESFCHFFQSFCSKFPDWTPTFICVAGDIAFKGAASEYDEAEQLIRRIADCARVPTRRVIMVPGNHDMSLPEEFRPKESRGTKEYKKYKADYQKAILRWLHSLWSNNADIPQEAGNLFARYAEFRNRFLEKDTTDSLDAGDDLLKKLFPPELSTLCGIRAYPERKVAFLELNSAWVDLPGEGNRECVFGANVIQSLEKRVTTLKHQGYYIVGVFHHPLRFIADNEYQARSFVPVYDLIVKMCDLCLSGHEHGDKAKDPDFLGNKCQYILNSGFFAIDSVNEKMESGASLLRIDPVNGSVELRRFTFDDINDWFEGYPAKRFSTSFGASEPLPGVMETDSTDASLQRGVEEDIVLCEQLLLERFGNRRIKKIGEPAHHELAGTTGGITAYVSIVGNSPRWGTPLRLPEANNGVIHVVLTLKEYLDDDRRRDLLAIERESQSLLMAGELVISEI